MSRISWLWLLAAVVLVAAACSSGLSVDVDAGDDEAGDEVATGSTDDEAPTPTATPEPEPTEAEEPTATPEPEPTATPDEPDAEAVAQSTFADLDGLPPGFFECAIGELIDNPALLLALDADADYEDLDPESQEALLDLGVNCLDDEAFAALFAEGFAEGAADDDVVLPDEVVQCLADTFATGDRRSFIEFGLSDTEVPDPATQALFVDALVTCIPGEVFVDLMLSGALDDPVLGGSAMDILDAECLEVVFDDEEFLRTFWGAAIEASIDDRDFDPETDIVLLGPVFDCVDFAAAFQAEAAADGFELSDESAQCLNDGIREIDLFSRLAAGEDVGEEEFVPIILDCLTIEELTALGGG